MKNFWDERYSTNNYVYGIQPNLFFKEQITKLPLGKLLLVGEGEGRNAIYAAMLGWQVHALDSSTVAKQKALKLAEDNNVAIHYETADVLNYNFGANSYDAIGIIFFHINEQESSSFFKRLYDALKPNGKIILELFSKNQLGKKSGGPQDLNVLCSIEQIHKSFPLLKPEILIEENIYLSEGEFHQGEASVIRFVGVK